MTQEEKQLLLKDLCARVPYGIMFDYNNNEPLKIEGIVRNIVYYKVYNYQTEGDECYANITECKPYLRPLESQTDEEMQERGECVGDVMRMDYYYSHHLDCHQFIRRGLALEAPEDMYKFE